LRIHYEQRYLQNKEYPKSIVCFKHSLFHTNFVLQR